MSFSFRNIFNPDDGDSEGMPPQSGGDSRHQVPFSSPEGGGRKPTPSQTFQVSELLPFIPPAIAAETGIPMTREVDIPLSADGSNDVLLSTIYQVCPELFAAEITPLNESTVTLPAKLNSIPEPAPGSNSPLMPGAAFSKPPGMASSSAAPAQNSPPASSGSEKINPFWSPAEGEAAPDSKQQTLNDMSDPHSQPRAASNSAESKTPQGLGGFESSQGKSEPQKPAPPAAGPDPISQGFSAPGLSGANPFESKAGSKNEDSAGADQPSPSSQFSGNPFESDEGYSTLFSTQAKEDSDIPFPSPSAKPAAPEEAGPRPGKASEGTWGTMFDAKAEPDSAPDSADISKGFESIGNLIPGKSAPPEASAKPEAPATPTPAGGNAFGSAEGDDDYGLFLPPMNEEHELPAGFQMGAPVDETPEVEKVEAPVEEEAMRPSFGFEAALQSIPKGFSDAESEKPRPAPAATPEAEPAPPIADLAPVFPEPVKEAAEMPAPAAPDSGPAPSSEPPATASVNAFTGSPTAPVEESQPAPSVPAQAEPAPVAKPEPVVTSEPEPEFEEFIAPAPVAASAAIPGLSQSGEIRDLELRAIFSTSDSFTLRSVARRVVALPGIASCALATPGRLVQASRNEESRIGDEAKEMVQTIRNLAKLTGLPDAQSFTLHTDKGIVSLFLDGECCVTVHHETAEFEPGTREKLILISRNLEKLEK